MNATGTHVLTPPLITPPPPLPACCTQAVRAKIVEGRLEKMKKGWALMEQPALRDNDTVGGGGMGAPGAAAC